MKHVSILLAALVVVLGIHSFTHADAPAGVQKWEYLSFGADTEELLKGAKVPHPALRSAGADGWELVAVTATGSTMQLLTFKRPFAVPRDARANTAVAQMYVIGGAIDYYTIVSKSLPKSLDELTQPSPKSGESFLTKIPNDPWGEPYHYKVINAARREYEIRSAGQDKQFGTADDLSYPERR